MSDTPAYEPTEKEINDKVRESGGALIYVQARQVLINHRAEADANAAKEAAEAQSAAAETDVNAAKEAAAVTPAKSSKKKGE